MHWKALSAVLICSVLGCMDATKIAPKVADLGIGLNVEMLESGRYVYLNRCTKCHNAVRITRYSLQEWQDEILPDMSRESKLSVAQEKAVTAYIKAVIANAE